MQRRIKQAQKYLEWDQPNQAIAELRPALNNEIVDQKYRWLPNHMMGIALSLKGDHEASASYFEKAIKYGSAQPETYHMLSVNYYNLGRFEEAEKQGNEAVKRKGDFLKAWLNLGSVYQSQAKLDKALECYKKANELDPSNAGVAFRIGEIYRDQGDLDQALTLFEITLKIDDSYNRAMLEIADIYKKKGDFAEAQRCLLEKKEKHGDSIASKVSLAELYKEKGDYDQAIEIYEELLEEQPDNGALRINYALCLQELSRFDESENHYRCAIEAMPGRQEPISNYLMGLHYNPNNTKEYIFEEHRRMVSNFTEDQKEARPMPDDIAEDKKLKIGFVSGGFRRHPVGFMIVGGLEQLPGDQFDIYCYTTSNKFDFITRRIHKNIDVWRSVVGYSSKVLSKIIREDEIDILIDLSGHAENTRLQVMAKEPAPVIVKWVGGLFNTTGLECFDFLISDNYESPEGEEPFYTEKLVRMPDDYISYTPPAYAPEVGALPAKENGYITFGCFNNPTKVNEEILGQWAEIMKTTSHSHLYLKSKQYDTASFRDQILRFLDGKGISSERIEFEGHTSHDDHLECYNKVDIALDPWPYSGGLTTCEALFMGVPVITLPGPTFAGRHSTTHLMNAGLEQWVTNSWDEYVKTTVALASDQVAIVEWRNELRKQLLESPVCDGKRFGAHLAVAFREMWKQRVAGYKKSTADWQDHITVDRLSLSRIKQLTDGPDKTPRITIKDKDSPRSTNAINQKDMQKEVLEESAKDTMNITNEYLDGNSKNKRVDDKSIGIADNLEEYQVEVTGGVRVCVPNDLDVLTTYVLREQGQWFEPEVDFLREYVQTGMKVVDIGACFGTYALPLAQKVGPGGRVFAFEPSAESRNYLEKSKLVNRLDQLEVISRGIADEHRQVSMTHAQSPEFHTVSEEGSEQINVTKFDAWWRYAGKPNLDVIKIDVNGMETEVLAGASCLLDGTAPVLVIASGENEIDLVKVREQLNERGYRIYEYISGIGLLAEHDPEAGVDPYLINIVAISENRVQEFEETGWIFDDCVEIEATDPHKWKELLGSQPWAESLLGGWEENISGGNNELYLQALNLACAAEQIKISAEDLASRSKKGAMMLVAAQNLTELFNKGRAGIPAALTYVRVMSRLGKKMQAVEMAKQLMETVNSGNKFVADLPFLPPFPEQDNTTIETEFSNWLTIRIVEAWIALKTPTTCMAGDQEKQMLQALEGNPERTHRFLNIPSLDVKEVTKQPRIRNSTHRNKLPDDWNTTMFNMMLRARPLEIKKHGLPSDLVISITSYPDRFDTLHLTLACLLNQTIMPDRLVLWIAHQDREALPKEVLNLRQYGLEIKLCEDIKSYKKIIPTLKNNPDCFIVTADDDVYYWQTWLEELVKGWHRNKDCVIAHRVHRIKKKSETSLFPYSQWDLNFTKDLTPSRLNFPTGIGGVLYPPGVFHEDVLDIEIFMDLCPHGDDIWLYWMYRMNGVEVKPTGKNRMFINWPDSQDGALWKENLNNGRNDEQIQNLISEYGFSSKSKQDSIENIFTVYVEQKNYKIKLPDWKLDHIQHIIAMNNTPYELEMLKDMAQRVSPGDLMVDAGANIGNHSLFMALIAQCKVLAFEPNTHLLDAFNKSIELNGLTSQLQVVGKGLGSQEATASFECHNPQNLGAQRLRVSNDDGGIEVTTLDSMELDRKVKLIKIDVEGMELDVLEGAQTTLTKDLPVIYVEGATKNELSEINQFLEKIGYSYQKSFNATPTHLYLPENQSSKI